MYAARAALVARNSSHQIACMDMAPVHLTRTDHKPVSKARTMGWTGTSRVLDWYFCNGQDGGPVARSAGSATTARGATTRTASDKPGASFYGEALAAAGLVPPGPRPSRASTGVSGGFEQDARSSLPRREREAIFQRARNLRLVLVVALPRRDLTGPRARAAQTPKQKRARRGSASSAAAIFSNKSRRRRTGTARREQNPNARLGRGSQLPRRPVRE